MPSECCNVSTNILTRLSLKVHAYESSHNDGLSRKPKGDAGRGGPSTSGGDAQPNLDLPFLKDRIHEFKVHEAQNLKKGSAYAPKQLLSEFSDYGTRLKRNWKGVFTATPKSDPCRDLVALIDTLDQRLSTNEALAIFKELGVEYQPRSASGKKNMMASDLSLALAPNGLKITEPSVNPSKEGSEISSGTILADSNRCSSSDSAVS